MFTISDKSVAQAALSGIRRQIEALQEAADKIQASLNPTTASKPKPPGGTIRKRSLSAAARKRIADAQKKRWAEYRKSQKE